MWQNNENSKKSQIQCTDPIFKQFKLLKVNHIRQMQEFKCYHKFKNNTLPAYLQHLNLLPNSSIHSHNTRGKTDLHIHRTTHTFAKQCLRQNIPVLLNNAPSSITDKFLTHSIQGFSNYVKNHFVNKYQQHCTIPNCYIYVNYNGCTPSCSSSWSSTVNLQINLTIW